MVKHTLNFEVHDGTITVTPTCGQYNIKCRTNQIKATFGRIRAEGAPVQEIEGPNDVLLTADDLLSLALNIIKYVGNGNGDEV